MKIQSHLVLLSLSAVLCVNSSLIPEPEGPLYGIPFSTKAAARLIIPSTAAGKCEVLLLIFL